MLAGFFAAKIKFQIIRLINVTIMNKSKLEIQLNWFFTARKMTLKISSVNVIKSKIFCGFGPID